MKFLFVLFALVIAVVATALKDDAPTGTILSAQFYCEIPCEEKMGFYLSSTTPSAVNGVNNPIRLQQYLPPLPVETRQFNVFTAFDKDSSIFSTVAVNYPSNQKITVWTSKVSGGDAASMVAVPVLSEVVIDLPISSGPVPLNFAPLELAKVIGGPNGGLLAIFTNGEVHALDIDGKQFNLMHKLITDEKALSVDNPTTKAGHVFDHDRNGLWSVVSAGMFSYIVFTDFKTNTVGEWVKMDANMKLDPGVDAVTTDFSPEWFVNAMMVDAQNGQGSQLMLQLESVSDSVGFDMLTFVNTTSGVMTGPVQNLMNYNLLLTCQSFNCDYLRLSTYDPVGKAIYFQAHNMATGEEGNIVLGGLHLTETKNGMDSWYVDLANPSFDFGYAGFQYYNF